MNDSKSGSKLDARYQFHTRLAEGGMGEVSTAWDTQLNRTVAIKRMKSGSLELAQNTLQEAMRMASIRHPNIITVYDIGMDESTPYIVMEFVTGETFSDKVGKGVFTLEEFVDIAHQTFNGLIAAHHSGLIHRDLKPSNLMLMPLSSGGFQVKILDFGMAKFQSAPIEQTMNIDGTVTGSISWISPEQLNREAVDARTDLYSLGCIFYYVLAGIAPFDGESTWETLSAHLLQKVTSLEVYRPDLPLQLCQWVMVLINRQPEHRYQSAMEALSALLSIVPSSQPVIGMHSSGSSPIPVKAAPVLSESKLKPVTRGPLLNDETGFLPKPAPIPNPRGETPEFAEKQNRWLPVFGVAALFLVLASIGLSLFQILSTRKKEEPIIQASTPVLVPAPQKSVVSIEEKPVPSVVPTPVPTEIPAPQPVSTPPVVAEVTPTPTPSPVEVPAEIVFRVHGSNTIGAKLLPALMEDFLKNEGMTQIQRKNGADPETILIEALLPGKSTPQAVEISAHGSKTAFEDLISGKCDIGIASRAIKNEEADACAKIALGDMHSPGCEYVVGLDGIAILVNASNPVNNLTKQQIADLFSGHITDWAQLGGTPGPINLYARDAKSGTFDTFKSLVMGGNQELSSLAKRFEDSNELSDSVAADPNGIGFVGLPFVRNAKALSVSEPGTLPFMATPFTVATEDYLLSRRLYIYTPANPKNQFTRKFIEFALGDQGQDIVKKIGFIKQSPDLQHPALPDNAPKEYTNAVKNAERLSLNFRFRPNSTDLDNKSVRDLTRIINLLQQNKYHDRNLLLFGFTDGKGDPNINLKLSKVRAEAVAKELSMRGLAPTVVTGFGPALPVASNETDQGREKNRRVEIWISADSTQAMDNVKGITKQ